MGTREGQKVFVSGDGETRFVFEAGRLTIQKKQLITGKDSARSFRWMGVDRYTLTENRSMHMNGEW